MLPLLLKKRIYREGQFEANPKFNPSELSSIKLKAFKLKINNERLKASIFSCFFLFISLFFIALFYYIFNRVTAVVPSSVERSGIRPITSFTALPHGALDAHNPEDPACMPSYQVNSNTGIVKNFMRFLCWSSLPHQKVTSVEECM